MHPLYRKAAKCPVGNEKLGYFIKGEISSFVCEDCGFVYTWDVDGNLLAPVKVKHTKEPETCDCNSCTYRDTMRE